MDVIFRQEKAKRMICTSHIVTGINTHSKLALELVFDSFQLSYVDIVQEATVAEVVRRLSISKYVLMCVCNKMCVYLFIHPGFYGTALFFACSLVY